MSHFRKSSVRFISRIDFAVSCRAWNWRAYQRGWDGCICMPGIGFLSLDSIMVLICMRIFVLFGFDFNIYIAHKVTISQYYRDPWWITWLKHVIEVMYLTFADIVNRNTKVTIGAPVMPWSSQSISLIVCSTCIRIMSYRECQLHGCNCSKHR